MHRAKFALDIGRGELDGSQCMQWPDIEAVGLQTKRMEDLLQQLHQLLPFSNIRHVSNQQHAISKTEPAVPHV